MHACALHADACMEMECMRGVRRITSVDAIPCGASEKGLGRRQGYNEDWQRGKLR
jgi:hypothetical protein